MSKFLHQSRLRRWGKRLAILVACIVAFYSIEHWRGKRTWDAFRSEWEAKGERFEEPEIALVPDEQNVAMVPLMQELTEIWQAHPDWFQYTPNQPNHDRGRLHQLGRELSVKSLARQAKTEKCVVLQLAGGTWTINDQILPSSEADAAREIVARFEDFSDTIEEIDTMLELPALALPARDRNDVTATNPPHPDVLYIVARAFHLRARAQIHLNDGGAALADLERSLTIGKLLRQERTSLFRSWQMSTSVFSTVAPVIWEGLFSNTWDSAQLGRLQQHIDEINFASGLLTYLRLSRTYDINTATSSKERSRHNAGVKAWNASARKALGNKFSENVGYSRLEPLRPQGWRYVALTRRMKAWQTAVFTKADESLNFDTVSLEMVIASKELETGNSRHGPSAVQRVIRDTAKHVGLKYKPRPMPNRNLPELGEHAPMLVEGYTFRRNNLQRLISTAIALERFKLEHGNYPKDLADLVPNYLAKLPTDPWDAEQKLLRYTIRPGGRPALWSIGDNRQDENGFLGDGYGDSDDILWHYEIAPDDPDHPDRIAERKAQRSSRRAAKRKATTKGP